jgi:uncharacterized ion transporter superfamily protein YfcC
MNSEDLVPLAILTVLALLIGMLIVMVVGMLWFGWFDHHCPADFYDWQRTVGKVTYHHCFPVQK